MQRMLEEDPHKIRKIYGKRLMNAKGYVMFWEIHIKKHPDDFALKMLEVAKKILIKTQEEIDKI